MDDTEDMDLNNPVDDEETERKLLAGSDEELDDEGKLDDENVDLGSDSDEEKMETSTAAATKGSDSDDDSDSDDNDEEDNAADEAEVQNFVSILEQNPYDYEAHKSLIEKLQTMGCLDRLRNARENMSAKYPLTSEIWLSWLKDEMKLAVTPEQKLPVLELCDRAVKDYLSVEVWLEYLIFSTGLGTEEENVEKIRDIFERALTDAGLHVTKGSLIWDAYREFENFILLMMNADDSGKLDQINRIGKIFKRQLACPLYGKEKTFEEYQLWRSSEGSSCTEDEKIIKSGYDRALAELEVRKPFEKKIESSNSKEELLDAYNAYLMKEKQIGDPGRVSVLYERAVADLSLEPTLWLDYILYVQNNIKIYEIVEKIYAKAVRNVPWYVKIWQAWIRYLEKKKSPMSEVQQVVENALAVGFASPVEYKDLWISYLEYLRRGIDKAPDESKHIVIVRNAFDRACEHLASFGLEGDPNCEVVQFWARFEAIQANNMEKARQLWADIMSQGHSGSYASWLEYLSLEKCYGDTKHLRKLFPKALTATVDWPESIANSWINFERDEGTLEQMEVCEAKTKECLEKVAQNRKAQENMQKHETVVKKPLKRKAEDVPKWKDVGIVESKIIKTDKMGKANIKNGPTATLPKADKEHGSQIKSAPPPGYKKPVEEHMDTTESEAETHEFQKVKDQITVFVSNLDYSTTEEEVKAVLESVGPITLIRMVKDFKGRNKGFCYVQFENENQVEEALKLDRTPINNRPMFISRCDPDKTSRGPIFKYKTELEKNKLFVKGLPPSTTKEQLEEIFKVHGNLKDVRIVTYRNGHSKGLAYVDFENEVDAGKALVATDGMTIEDKVISVAISQPPQRKPTPGDDNLRIKSLGGSSQSRSHFGGPKSVLSLVPRVLKTTATSDVVPGNGVAKAKTNEDFRNMLLKK
ncbi:hypothetical protein TKK_0002651 [Trichogramma kaykai]|uniref:RRM domain-containing protein n=1 Tax=Trichogramma kaykai TaxID=54128 RepID=A0ABD2XSF1_9HYME